MKPKEAEADKPAGPAAALGEAGYRGPAAGEPGVAVAVAGLAQPHGGTARRPGPGAGAGRVHAAEAREPAQPPDPVGGPRPA